MMVVLTCIFLIASIFGIVNAARIIQSVNWLVLLRSQEHSLKIFPQIIVLIPALEEQFVIIETINRLRNLNYFGRFLSVIITTEKECKLKGQKSTGDIVKAEISSAENIIHLHYPHKDGVKADQLNWAL